ncbi:MAG: IMPACT family protein [Fidelibacterota bacterium]
MSYTLPRKFQSTLKIKRSEFICHLFPLDQPEIMNVHLKNYRKRYSKARHFCWAYRFLHDGRLQENSSDAGEPSGSAGAPILKALRQADLVQSGAVVVRIFGGIKLGKRGLIEAYYTSVHRTVQTASLLPFVEETTAILSGQLKHFNDYRLLLERFQGNIIADHSQSDLKWTITIPRELYVNYEKMMMERFGSDILLNKKE